MTDDALNLLRELVAQVGAADAMATMTAEYDAARAAEYRAARRAALRELSGLAAALAAGEEVSRDAA